MHKTFRFDTFIIVGGVVSLFYSHLSRLIFSPSIPESWGIKPPKKVAQIFLRDQICLNKGSSCFTSKTIYVADLRGRVGGGLFPTYKKAHTRVTFWLCGGTGEENNVIAFL